MNAKDTAAVLAGFIADGPDRRIALMARERL
jgi:hypothetical protein